MYPVSIPYGSVGLSYCAYLRCDGATGIGGCGEAISTMQKGLNPCSFGFKSQSVALNIVRYPEPIQRSTPASLAAAYRYAPYIQCAPMPGCSASSRHGSPGTLAPWHPGTLAPWQLAGRGGRGSGGAPSTRPGQGSFSEGPQTLKFFLNPAPQSPIFSKPLPNPSLW